MKDYIKEIERDLRFFSSAYSGVKTGQWSEEGFREQCLNMIVNVENLLALVKAYEGKIHGLHYFGEASTQQTKKQIFEKAEEK